jgi:hypothetical protein
MTKRRKEQTIQWPKEGKNRQYNGQKKKRTNNTMAKRRKEQTIEWPKEGKNRQYNGQKKKRANNTMTKRKLTISQRLIYHINQLENKQHEPY